MKIAFYKGLKYGNWLDKLICLGTMSRYSHCEIVFSDGVSASSSPRDGGVRFKNINYSDDKWTLFDVIYPSDVDFEAMVRYHFAVHEGDKYDYLGAFFSAFGIDASSDDRKFCSQICGLILGSTNSGVITPGGLKKRMKLKGQIQ